ncbi:hypothetical protein R3P38DRAFT_2889653, partial [Favolaschia claudopus]
PYLLLLQPALSSSPHAALNRPHSSCMPPKARMPFTTAEKTSVDIEAAGGCLVPGESMDGPMPDLSAKKTRRGVYADYRRWFSFKAPAVPVMEKDHLEDLEPRNRGSKFEQRLQVGSWCAMAVL